MRSEKLVGGKIVERRKGIENCKNHRYKSWKIKWNRYKMRLCKKLNQKIAPPNVANILVE